MLFISLCLDPGNSVIVVLDVSICLLGHQVSYLKAFDICHETGFLHVGTHTSAVHIIWFSGGVNIIVYE